MTFPCQGGFNGAILLQGWKWAKRGRCTTWDWRFNGAILLQGWKSTFWGENRKRRWWLQWGHPFARMEMHEPHMLNPSSMPLQWGHPFARMEIRRRPP